MLMYDKIYEGTFVGGNLSTAIKNRTKTGGAVVWGGIRDLEQIEGIEGLQVYYRGVDPTPEAVLRQQGQQARVINMGMGQQHIIHLRLAHRKLCILKGIDALLHTIIHQNMFVSDL